LAATQVAVGLLEQWKQPRTRRRKLIALGISPEEVKLASRIRKGYWRMSGKSIVQRARTKSWLHQQGLPELRPLWVTLHYGTGGNAKSSI